MNKPTCFGGLSCPIKYPDCPCIEECTDEFGDELAGVPLTVFDVVYDWRMLEILRARTKTYAWKCRVKVVKK